MLQTIDCPNSTAIRRMLREELDADEATRLEAHVEGCPCCQQTLDRLAREVGGPVGELIVRLNAPADAIVERTAGYAAKHPTRLGYAERPAAGRSIGSGAVEGGIEQLVNLRMKRTGALAGGARRPDESNPSLAVPVGRGVTNTPQRRGTPRGNFDLSGLSFAVNFRQSLRGGGEWNNFGLSITCTHSSTG